MARHLSERAEAPCFRDRTELRIDKQHSLVTRKAEVHEPLEIDALHHLFEELDPQVVVLDEVVVIGENCADLALSR